MKNQRVAHAYLVLKIVYGIVPIVAGLDKFLGILADWEAYLSPFARALLPVDPGVFMALVGVIEIAVGITILTKFTRLGAYVAAVWLALIGVNLLLAGIPDVAVRDFVMAVGAYTLAQLAAAHEAAATAGAEIRETRRLAA